jgi:hypothetical protein
MTTSALTTTRPVAHAPLRRLPVPACEPPFDDELGRHHGARSGRPGHADGSVQGTLALAFLLPSGLPSSPVPEPGPVLRLVPDLPARRGHTGDDLADFGPQPTGRAALTDPSTWARRLVQALVEVLAGDRPLTQLVRWTSTEVYDDVAALLPGRRTGRAAAAGRRAADEAVRAAVCSVHLTEPADGVAEVSATVRRGGRTTAVALRLEGLDGRWQCTALELG